MSNSMSPSERRALVILMKCYPSPAPFDVMIYGLWGNSGQKDDMHSLRVAITRLRAKIGHKTVGLVSGLGYTIDPDLVPEWARQQVDAEQKADRLVRSDGILNEDQARSILMTTSRRSKYRVSRKRPSKDGTSRGQWACLTQPGGCACRCHRLTEGVRKRIAEKGDFHQTRHDGWKPEHERALIKIWEKSYWLPDVAREISMRFKISRTQRAVKHRLLALGRNLREGYLTVNEAANALGVPRWLTTRWINEERLPSRRHYNGSGWIVIMRQDLEAFMWRSDTPLSSQAILDPRLRLVREMAEAEMARIAAEKALTS